MRSIKASASILHADLDAFYASVEQRDDPALRDRPVLVGGGVVLACSYEAKACGVRAAMNGGQARALCPDAVVVEPRMEAYTQASREVFEIFDDHPLQFADFKSIVISGKTSCFVQGLCIIWHIAGSQVTKFTVVLIL